jgi:diguanylate cyclase (GGDEF)-like protein/PAS domain S-box-containing protein
MSNERDKYLTIFEIIPNPAIVLDVENRVDNINNGAVELLQEVSNKILNHHERTQIEALFPWLAGEIHSFVSGTGLEFSFEKDLVTKKGLRHFEVRLKKMLDLDENFIGTIVILNDISHLKQAERAVASARDFYLTLFEKFPALIWRSGLEGRYDYFNEAWLNFTGRTLAQEVGDGWQENIYEEDLERRLKSYLNAFKERRPFETEYRLRRSDGKFRWLYDVGTPFHDLDGNFAGYVGSCTDITDRKEHEDELTRLATHDALTGLPNRRILEEYLGRAIGRTGRGIPSALVFIDIDRFKVVNDTYGHANGDHALINLGLLLTQQLRESDLVARVGGDEFAVLLEGMGLKEAFTVAERLRLSVAEHLFIFEGRRHKLTFSAGLVIIEEKDMASTFMSRADAAMYKAKEEGRNRTIVA